MSMLILDSGHFSCIKILQIFSGFSPKGIHGIWFSIQAGRPLSLQRPASPPSLMRDCFSLLSHKLFPSALIKA